VEGLKVEQWPIDRLIPYVRNPRKNDEQVDRMASAIREFGFRIPIVAKSDGSLVDGHLRLKAAQKLGLKEVPVALADELTDAQVKAFRILANKSANWAEWDTDMLALEIEDLKELDFDLELTGFELPELDDILGAGAVGGTEGQTDPDAVPEVQEEPVSRLGDVWLLGGHRLMCGDSTDAGSVALLMNGKADLVLTDPPYGVKRDKGFGGAEAFNGKGAPIKRRAYDDTWDAGTPSQEAFDLMLAQAQKAIVFGGNFFTDKLPCSGFWLVWDKHNTMPTFGDCELAWTNLPRQSVKKYDIQYNGLIGKEKERFHPTQKPVGLFEAILADFSAEGQTILDLFGGSGSTLIACEKTGRVCRMMELSPRYVDVIVRRWQEFTGQEATLEEDGRTFAQVKEERGA
jgi:DNA modification methylase